MKFLNAVFLYSSFFFQVSHKTIQNFFLDEDWDDLPGNVCKHLNLKIASYPRTLRDICDSVG